ncbi:XRE family transcriptional regulator [Nocardia sp. XZ_19_369]|uniref:XRE family transcriptional regulator n=1 Tax=Nocardia sp. XZ_19_369 TaxID=2769487 RepID=UPI00188F163E|nr:XRE family transcriptional regulator [Nocardia sp. XZ_19_369]
MTPSMLSEWELGKHSTSDKYRRRLAEYYACPAEELFAHQDRAFGEPRLMVEYRALHQAMLEVVTGAQRYLVVVGSRSRDRGYLDAIEATLTEHPDLVHYRILFGPPRHRILLEHLLRLIDLRDPEDRSRGFKTLHITLIDHITNPDLPERFFCANEHAAVVPVPSLNSAENFDSGVVLGQVAGTRYIDHVRQLYAAGRRVETRTQLQALLP